MPGTGSRKTPMAMVNAKKNQQPVRNMTAVYEKIGTDYAAKRMPDVHWIDQLSQHFRHQRTLINIGAGTGSYEPDQLNVVALEPSTVMIQQRSSTAAPVIRGIAEQLPFKDQTFDIALAILTIHHWTDACKGLAEMRRVSRKQIVLTWDPVFFAEHFWLVRDYLPQALERESGLATLGTVKDQFDNATVQSLNVPADCSDGFFGAYWKRPIAYLDPLSGVPYPGLRCCTRKLFHGR